MTDQQIASRLKADLFLLHAISVHDFREHDVVAAAVTWQLLAAICIYTGTFPPFAAAQERSHQLIRPACGRCALDDLSELNAFITCHPFLLRGDIDCMVDCIYRSEKMSSGHGLPFVNQGDVESRPMPGTAFRNKEHRLMDILAVYIDQLPQQSAQRVLPSEVWRELEKGKITSR